MKSKEIEKSLERFARYIWGLSPHNFYDRSFKGIANDNSPLDPYKVMDYIKRLAKDFKEN